MADYLSSTSDSYTSTTGVKLDSIIVGTKASSAVVTVYDGSATTADSYCVIDAATNNGSYPFNRYFPNGLYVGMSGGNAKVTVITS
jgi:hypothetical protein